MPTGRTITISAAIVITITLSSMALLLGLFWGSPPNITLDVIRTAANLGIGTGGGAALWLAARKQQTASRCRSSGEEVLMCPAASGLPPL